LDGASYYTGSGEGITNLYSNLDFNNFSLSCDVNVTALGANGFSFPISMGKNGGGFSIVEIGGKWYLLHQTVGQSATGVPVMLNKWTHLELQRRQFGSVVQSRLFMDGIDTGVQLNAGPTPPIAPILTVGANMTGDGVTPEGVFNGLIDNVAVHNYSLGNKPSIVSGPTALPDTTVLTGESLTLTASAAGGTPLTFYWRKNGTVVTNSNSGVASSVTFENVTTSDAGSYDVIVSNLLGSVTSAAISVTVLPPGVTDSATAATFHLGENDPGAVVGSAGGATTRDASGIKDLTANGTPGYSANVPAGGSTLSMSFDGKSYYQGKGGRWQAFYNGFDFSNFSLSCDVYMTAVGSAGFSFPLSIGANAGGGGGFAIVEVGGAWSVIHQGQQLSIAGPAVALNTWTHLELQRKDFGAGPETHLLIDGEDTGLSIAATPSNIQPVFTIGGNSTGAGIEGLFNGQIDNVSLRSFGSEGPTLSIVLAGGEARIACQGSPGVSYTLSRATSLNPAVWTDITSGVADGSGNVQLVDPAPPSAGAFYRASTP
jgi:hypothetical protein